MHYPFSGMDPFIEWNNWQGFHLLVCSELISQINRQLPKGYVCRGEVQLGIDLGFERRWVRPDAAVHAKSDPIATEMDARYSPASATAVLSADQVKHRYVQIEETATGLIVAVIEVLSPTNKVGDGMIQFLRKRQRYISTAIHLLEIDLLRQGQRYYDELLNYPKSAYGVFGYDALSSTCRYWAVNLDDTLPTVPLRLSEQLIVAVDVQRVVTEAWFKGKYEDEMDNYQLSTLPKTFTPQELEYLTRVTASGSS